MSLQPVLKTAKAQERLIDGIDFEVGREIRQRLHDAGADIAIEGVIARAHDDALPNEPLFVEVPRRAHLNAESLGLIAAGDHAAIVVGQDHDRLTPQGRRSHEA
jgi:hypothetical protein